MPKRWNFLSNHGLVILHIVQNPQATLREIALSTGLTERAVYQIVRELEEGLFITKRKVGRRNAYTLNREAILGYMVYDQIMIVDVAKIIWDAAQAR
jgi:DNA-binding transcriptional ArsR family regulator